MMTVIMMMVWYVNDDSDDDDNIIFAMQHVPMLGIEAGVRLIFLKLKLLDNDNNDIAKMILMSPIMTM